MRFEVLVEGQSERNVLHLILKQLLGAYGVNHTWKLHKFQGKGKFPENPEKKPNPKDRTLLHNLPSLLRGYGSSLDKNSAVIVLVDLGSENCVELKKRMVDLLDYCHPAPKVLFRIAIEELEAWYFGDRQAILETYPNANINVLNGYVQDSVCSTWELLADAIYPGGHASLKAKGCRYPLEEKENWSKTIPLKMIIDRNKSKSFQVFIDGVKRMLNENMPDFPVR